MMIFTLAMSLNSMMFNLMMPLRPIISLNLIISFNTTMFLNPIMSLTHECISPH